MVFHDATIFDPDVLAASIGLLIISIVAGIATYDESNRYLGPKDEYIEELAGDTSSADGWDTDLLVTDAGMIAENHAALGRNARGLRATNVLLGGIVVGVAATGLSVGRKDVFP